MPISGKLTGSKAEWNAVHLAQETNFMPYSVTVCTCERPVMHDHIIDILIIISANQKVVIKLRNEISN